MSVTQPPGFTQRVAGGDGGLRFMGGPASGLNFDFTGGSLPAGITFSRASTGTYFTSGGILTVAAINAPRFNYVGGVSCLLIEPAATNLLLQSNNFAATWFPNNAGVATAAQFISPDGTNNGWSLTSGSGFGGVGQFLAFSNVPYTISCWVKRIVGSAANLFYLNDKNSGDIATSTTIARLAATMTPAAGSNNAAISPNTGAGSTNGIFGAQLETGSKATSYIPTTTGTATRAADSATFTIPAGVTQLTYTFDDNSTQAAAVSPGSYTVPTGLNRPNIKSIQSSANIAAWGDSLTQGNQDGSGTTYPGALASLTAVMVYNGGVGGDTSTQIRTRMLAAPQYFARSTVIWAGHNNFGSQATVLADVAAMVAALPDARYLVLSITPNNNNNEFVGGAGYNQIVALNAALAAAYPANYLDVWAPLVAAYNPANAEDVIDNGHQAIPSTLRATYLNSGTLTNSIASSGFVSFVFTSSVQSLFSAVTVTIDGEKMWCGLSAPTGSGPYSYTVTSAIRGYAGTTAAAHTAGAIVSSIVDQAHLNAAGYQLVASRVYSKLRALALLP